MPSRSLQFNDKKNTIIYCNMYACWHYTYILDPSTFRFKPIHVLLKRHYKNKSGMPHATKLNPKIKECDLHD